MGIQHVLKIGHRGAAGHAPENTLAAISKGISVGADYVELDAQRTSDGALVLMHDKFVDRTTDGNGLVAELSSAALQRFDAGEGERIPLLEEALALASGRVGLVLEAVAPGIGVGIHRAVARSGFDGPVIFSSFLHAEILAIRKIDPSAKTMALLEGVPVRMAAFALEAGASHVGLAMDSITDEFVKALHDAGLQVFVFTVNDPRLIEIARNLGVDGIISDYPDRV